MATKKTAKKTSAPVSRASTTKTFLKTRTTTPTLGKWSSGFSACKKYADEKNVPLIAVWSNGDACGYCVNFEKSIMESAFTKWQASSKCVFWFGCSSDTSKDDKTQGTGFTWTRNGKLTTYPFCRVYWKGGKVDTYKSGSDWTGGTAKGGATFVKKLKDLLKNYKPEATTTTTTTTTPSASEPTCEDGSCSTGSCDCEALKNEIDNLNKQVDDLNKQIKELEIENGNLKTKVSSIQETWSTVIENIDSLDKAIR